VLSACLRACVRACGVCVVVSVMLQGMVLLKNAKVGSTGTELLPLDVTSYAGTAGSVLVAGPVADNGNNTLGNYACDRVRARPSFLSAFPMFVPSLSWQKDDFYI